ncbi:hypothetical protein [Streptomyces sp. MT206]|uniref:hypothetical protein n=1 Tax=Streptomyces sp. MT206 TaxID=3031407 RepID=UPI003FA75ABB
MYQSEVMAPCCAMGLVVQMAFARARSRHEVALKVSGEARTTYASVLVALVNWCEHQIDAHEANPGPVPGCASCSRFEVPVPPEAVGDEPALTVEEWAFERRIHQVAHRLAPRIVTLEPTSPSERPASGALLPVHGAAQSI